MRNARAGLSWAAWACFALVSGAAACGSRATTGVPPQTASTALPPGSPHEDPPLADAATWETWRKADYLVVTPRRFVDPLEPLVQHRLHEGHVVALLTVEDLFARYSGGQSDPKAIARAIGALASHTKGVLRFVLLAGDTARVPTFYLSKLSYEHHTPEEHAHGVDPSYHARYPSDEPYATVKLDGAESDRTSTTDRPVRLAVGRLPARTEEEMRGVVAKVVDYDVSGGAGPWQRRLSVLAGPANYGPLVDNMIESITAQMLDEDLSYDYDVRFTFARPESPYALGFDKLRAKFVDELDDGALFAAYVGHGAFDEFAPVYFRGRWYELGTVYDAAALRIPKGKPVFFSISCDTGAFDRPNGRASLAEEMILNPQGPIAVFASSRESHPYPNALYGQAIIARFVNEHARTVGEGIVAVKQMMHDQSIPAAELLVDADVEALKREHESLYNLLGDPATRLRYPEQARVSLGGDGTAKSGDTITVDVDSPATPEGRVTLTLETLRSAIRGPIVSASVIDDMPTPQAFKAMTENQRHATDKVILRKEQALSAGHTRFTLTAPGAAADYIVKALVVDADKGAAGHARFRVSPR